MEKFEESGKLEVNFSSDLSVWNLKAKKKE